MDYEIILNVLCIRNKNCKVRLLAFAAGAERVTLYCTCGITKED